MFNDGGSLAIQCHERHLAVLVNKRSRVRHNASVVTADIHFDLPTRICVGIYG